MESIAMTETPAQPPVFQMQRIYLKDASVEMPNAPTIFLEQGAPSIDVQLEIGGDALAQGIHECAIRVTVTAKVAEKVLFLAEVKQAGIFEIRNMPEQQVAAIQGIACPGIVWPYLRANVADLISRTGLPPVHLAEINFEAMYQQRLQQQAAGSPATEPAAPPTGAANGVQH
jgi:preprotein translocase subunit SecB